MNQINQTNQRNKPFRLIVFSLLLTLLATATVLLNMPPLTECRSEAPIAAKEYRVRATQTVVHPWQGQHHVYGIFSVPDRYRHDRLYTARLRIQGFNEELPDTSPEGGDNDTDRAEPGHYIKRVYLPTRTALWFLLTGRFGDLKMPCHWWLVIADRAG